MSRKMIDTHIHIWDLDKAKYNWLAGDTSILNRTYAIDELEEERVRVGITAGVLVQAAPDYRDTDWMLQVAANTEWIAGVVGWLPLLDTEATAKALEEKYGKNSYFKGVRHQIHDEADVNWLLQPAVINSLKIIAENGLSYDVVAVQPEHIETALKVADSIADLRMVFDHLSQPPIKSGKQFGRWGELMKKAATHQNCYAKISGLGTVIGNGRLTTGAEMKPYVEFVLAHFGTARCMCGGDWPVSLLAGGYPQTWQVYLQVLSELLNDDEQEKVLYGNAKAFYGLEI